MTKFNLENTYIGTVIRPPSEAESLIFQVTLGCTDNKCIFCPAYKDKPFRAKDLGLIQKEMSAAALQLPETRKIFLADGDALALPIDTLKIILDSAIKLFPNLTRVSAYGSVKSLEKKSVSDMQQLKGRKFGTAYLGFETGDPEVYNLICKYGSPQGNVETCLKVKEAGIKTNVTVILGLGGKKHTKNHAINTAKILSQAKPDQIAALTLMVAPKTPLFNMVRNRQFEELESFEYLEELHSLIENMEDFKCLFFSNHASNYFPIRARFPKDKKSIIKDLYEVIKGRKKSSLRPEFSRGL